MSDDAGHVIVVDLGYGDAGKGSVVDWLCSWPGNAGWPGRPPRTVVRFNGGAQAAHNVVRADGRHHTFAQFGAGTFVPGVRTHLSRFMQVDPLALAAEAAHLAEVGVPDALGRLSVDRDALLTTPYHRAANRARELARPAGRRHGSCGMGIGETARYALDYPADAPRAGDCAAPRRLERKLTLLRGRLLSTTAAGLPPVPDVCAAYLAFAGRVAIVDGDYLHGLLRDGPAVFEGAQGVLLDEWHGFHPFTTWSTTTFANAEVLLAEAGQRGIRLGVVRSYLTRHGPGPLVTEDPALELPEPHNAAGPWQGPFRTGHFDAVALRYAIEACGGVAAIALTHLDAAARQPLRICDGYLIDGRLTGRLAPHWDRDLARQERLTRSLLRAVPRYRETPAGRAGALAWPDLVGDALGVPVALVSAGPACLDKTLLSLPSLPPVSGQERRPAAAAPLRSR